MRYLKPVEEKKPAEEGPLGQGEALLIEGSEDHCLRAFLRRELLPIATLPTRDLLLGEEAALHQILHVLLSQGTWHPRLRRRRRIAGDLGEMLAIPGGREKIGSTTRSRRRTTKAKDDELQEGKRASSGKLGCE